MDDPFEQQQDVNSDIMDCLMCACSFSVSRAVVVGVRVRCRWQKGKSVETIIHQRDVVTNRIVRLGEQLRESGQCTQWFEGADPTVKHISRDVNGPLCEFVVAECGYGDKQVAEVFRKGGPLYGNMPVCGLGPEVAKQAKDSVRKSGRFAAREKVRIREHRIEDLWNDAERSNMLLADELKSDAFEQEFHTLVSKDAAEGWMSKPIPFSKDAFQARAVPGLGVQQGFKKDGSVKVRAVYNYSWCAPECGKSSSYRERKSRSVNGCTWLPEKLSHDHLDDLINFCRKMVLLLGVVPALFKADIASAFRRIPLMPEHVWAAGIMYRHAGRIWTSVHKSCPFGAKASVLNWERVGRFLCTVARRLLHIAMFEYVDDYFAAENPCVVEHAMQCFAKIVRALLGSSAIAADKLMFGASLDILGVNVMLAWDRFAMRPSNEEMKKCLVVINLALAEGVLRPGCASKLAGRLQWACQYMFHRLGRAMVRPLYAQCQSRNGSVCKDLRIALCWWQQVLHMDFVEEKFWKYPEAPLAHLFVDAAGKSSR